MDLTEICRRWVCQQCAVEETALSYITYLRPIEYWSPTFGGRRGKVPCENKAAVIVVITPPLTRTKWVSQGPQRSHKISKKPELGQWSLL